MALPWNRGDVTGRAPTWVDLVPLLGDSANDRSGDDSPERGDPVLVAPHRDPGEDAVNHDMPPEFERSRGSTAAPDESTTATPETPEATPAADRTPDDATPATVGPDADSRTVSTPGAASLDAITSDDAVASLDEEASATAEPQSDDREDESGDSTDLEDSVPVNGQ